MTHRSIDTKDAPRAIGPYSQAVLAGQFLFVSGQIPLDPATGELIRGSSEEQTRRAMENVGAILDAAGASYSNIVKTTIYLTDLADFAAVNSAYAEYFSSDHPARATVGVAALPLGANVEIEVVARLPKDNKTGNAE